MTNKACPELEALFEQLVDGHGPLLDHARRCESCSAALEEHRQLEKDLFRISDPLPPANFLNQVMARVAVEHAAPSRANIVTAVAILAATIAAGVFGLVRGGFGVAQLGTGAASAFVTGKSLWVGMATGMSVLWTNAAVPLAISLFAVLMICLYGLKRLAGDPQAFKEAKVSG